MYWLVRNWSCWITELVTTFQKKLQTAQRVLQIACSKSEVDEIVLQNWIANRVSKIFSNCFRKTTWCHSSRHQDSILVIIMLWLYRWGLEILCASYGDKSLRTVRLTYKNICTKHWNPIIGTCKVSKPLWHLKEEAYSVLQKTGDHCRYEVHGTMISTYIRTSVFVSHDQRKRFLALGLPRKCWLYGGRGFGLIHPVSKLSHWTVFLVSI